MTDHPKKTFYFSAFLHLWGGICMKIFAEKSGLIDVIIYALKGTDKSSAAIAAGILIAGSIVIGYSLSSSLVKAIDASSYAHKIKKAIKISLPLFYFIVAFSLSINIRPFLVSAGHTEQARTSTIDSSNVAPVVTVSTLQDTEGFTEADLSLEGLKNIEMWSVATVVNKARSSYAETGNDPSEFNPFPVSDSQYITVGGKKFAIIKITIYPSKNDHTHAIKIVRIFGFTQKGFETVGCTRNSNHDILLWSGECGEKIREVFGVSMQP